MKKSLALLFSFIATMLYAQTPIELPLWPDSAPDANVPAGKQENLNGGSAADIVTPTITVYRPSSPNGMAIIMCPGGGYSHLALAHEGHDMASWFNAQGITYIVLKYRMPNGHREIPLSDAEQAIRLVRQHAAEWKVNPSRVGIMGASAGGHLAASLATLYGSDETRPDFQILFYPVITMGADTHRGSRINLLGENPSDALIWEYSLENRVTSHTPQAFIMFSTDDTAVPPVNSINFYLALIRQKVPATLHAYPAGGHGWGFRDSFIYKRQWTGELEEWLRKGLKFAE